ncbi:mitochondrial outer membrane protein IML2 [Rhizoctonia solani]|uniref:Mitochondrial outer membrane protein IML2 n=1 Tax=Rhizoctonia solani TaxID=456999 RepID=A0A8H8NSZ6_9AGAM|nr:mitochondrial outer membrane protein IML2 [Rhizoctonia solani]QRW17672.1 mitochondrial outer membrane protein IML2 [Rhizoctonia solani]
MASPEATLRDLTAATNGFKSLLNDDVEGAKKLFGEGDSPFHLLGLGVVDFLKAALGMEEDLMPGAVKSLTDAEAGSKAAAKATRLAKGNAPSKYPIGMEHEICQADATVLLGLTQALSESYMGYLQCMYSLNSAHGKFSKMYKQVFPHGLGSYGTPAQTPSVSRKPSTANVAVSVPVSGTQTPASGTSSAASSIVNGKTGASTPVIPVSKPSGGFLSRLTSKVTQSTPSLTPGPSDNGVLVPEGPIEELIVAGAAFGYGLFNLVFSLLPNKVKKVVGFLGYQSDRRLGLEALHVAAGVENDVHSAFAAINISFSAHFLPYLGSLVLMTYNGVVLLLAGWQADEERIVRQYRDMLISVECKYPHGSLWILNRAKLERMTGNPDKAIEILREGLSPSRAMKFQQADALLMFELSWTLLADRQYEDAAESFLKIISMNSWSHATYTYIAAGCYLSIAKNKPEYKAKARSLLDSIPKLLERKKIGGKDLPTEVFIQKKIDFYKRKHVRRAGPGTENDYIDSIAISPAEELAICKILLIEIRGLDTNDKKSLEHALSDHAYHRAGSHREPRCAIAACDHWIDFSTSGREPRLDTVDELVVRDLLLGILYRAAGDYTLSRKYLEAVPLRENEVEGKWTAQVAKFELAVLDLRQVAHEPTSARDKWQAALKAANGHLDQAAARSNANVDLSSRLDSRIMLLRDEIEVKSQALGLK